MYRRKDFWRVVVKIRQSNNKYFEDYFIDEFADRCQIVVYNQTSIAVLDFYHIVKWNVLFITLYTSSLTSYVEFRQFCNSKLNNCFLDNGMSFINEKVKEYVISIDTISSNIKRSYIYFPILSLTVHLKWLISLTVKRLWKTLKCNVGGDRVFLISYIFEFATTKWFIGGLSKMEPHIICHQNYQDLFKKYFYNP